MWAKAWQEKCLITNDPSVEGAEKRIEKWGHWAKACWALVVLEAKSE